MADLITLILAAAKDFQVLIVILFFIGILLIVASMAEIQSGIIKINSDNKRKAFLSGIAITAFSSLILVALLVNSMGVEVSGKVEYASGLPVRNADIYIGDVDTGKYYGKTNAKGEYKIAGIPRNENLITVFIKGKPFYDTLDLPIWPMVDKKIIIMPIDLLVQGQVEDENGYRVEGAYVNISGEKDLSNKTDSMGEFSFGKMEVDPVPSKPLILDIRLRIEPRPRSKTVLEIPKEEPYEIYLSVTLPPKDWVDVSGYVRLQDNYTDRNPKEMASVIVVMGGRTAQTKDDGSYIIYRVPIDTTDYAIGFADGKRLLDHPILPPLMDSYETPRSRNLTVYKSELNMS
jgi:hypothetical protein